MNQIVVDTYKLSRYAERIKVVNKRIIKLDGRINQLYKNVGLVDLLTLINANILTRYNSNLIKCSTYLYDVQRNFDNVEKKISEQKADGISSKPILANNYSFSAVDTLTNEMKDLKEAFTYIDTKYNDLPIWMRENLKWATEKLLDKNKNIISAYEITDMFITGDVEGALDKIYKKLSGYAGNGIGKIVFGVDKLSWEQELYGKYIVNSIWGGIEGYKEYWKDPSLTSLGNVVWNSTVGSVLETVGDQAYDVVSRIPIISDWYEEYGATDMEGMFNVMYTEWTKAIYGDNVGEYVSTYYADNGGLYKGLVNGFSDIKSEVDKSCEKHGGLFGVWLSGWNSIFN